jgi:hypothetical protein
MFQELNMFLSRKRGSMYPLLYMSSWNFIFLGYKLETTWKQQSNSHISNMDCVNDKYSGQDKRKSVYEFRLRAFPFLLILHANSTSITDTSV